GAGLTGSETALFLAQQGRKVIVVDMLPLERIDKESPFVNIIALRNMMDELDIDIRTEMRLEAVTDAGAVIKDRQGRQTLVPCDTVVLALGVEPRREAMMRFEDLAPEVRAVGDCSKERGNLYSATLQGFFAAMDL